MNKTKLTQFDPNELVAMITDAFMERRGVFQNLVNAESLIPNGTSPHEKALFLFYVIQLDYATRSQILYQRAQYLWSRAKIIFTPEYQCRLNKYALSTMIEGYLRPRYPKEALRRWRTNSKLLLTQFKSDPRNIFLTSADALAVIHNIYIFRGFGPKIGNFFFRSMVNTFKFELSNIEEVTPPIDIHDVRLTYEWGLIDSAEMSRKNIARVKQLWQNACKQCRISWLVFDRALWILGSEGIRTADPKRDLITNLAL